MLRKTSDRTQRRRADARRAARVLERLFEDFGLDVRQQAHWNHLSALTTGLYGRRRKPGRPKGSLEWTPRRLIVLALHWRKVLIERVGPERASLWGLYSKKRPPITLKESVRLIRERFPDEYEGISDRAISRELRKAKRYQEEAEMQEHWWRESERARERERESKREWLERELELYADDDPHRGWLERELERLQDGKRDFS